MMSVAMSLNFHIAAVVASGFDMEHFLWISHPAVSEMVFFQTSI